MRPFLILALVLLVPIVPFLAIGDRLEESVLTWLEPPPPAGLLAGATAAILATDIFLPVPSSVVGTLAGAQLGVAMASAAIWLGLTAGCVAGFALARRWGRPLANRFCKPDDVATLDAAADRFGAWLIALSRPLPVLAEATVLWLGASRMTWRTFLPIVALSNLGLAVAYAALGHFGRQQGQLATAVAASVLVPLAATGVARALTPRKPTTVESDIQESQQHV